MKLQKTIKFGKEFRRVKYKDEGKLMDLLIAYKSDRNFWGRRMWSGHVTLHSKTMMIWRNL